MKSLAVGLALLLGTATSGWAQDQATIQRLADELAATINAGDAAAIADKYLEDAVILPPGVGMIRGREAIRAFWADAVQGIQDLQLTVVDVQPLGAETAREIGTFTFAPAEEPRQQVTGKYVVILHRQGDTWKIGTDIWNMND